MSNLRYDDAAMRVSPISLAELPLVAAHDQVETLRADGAHGFFELPFDVEGANFLQRKAAALKKRGFKRLLVIGIGGSDLGARTLHQALAKPGKGMDVWFLGTPDPEVMGRVTQAGSIWKSTAVYVVSKSGGTLETLTLFLAVRGALIKAVGEKKYASHVLVTTDEAERNPLLAFAREEGYEIIPHPLNVGGRFSVLSTVGLFPAACAGINVRAVLDGARAMEEERRSLGANSIAARFAANQVVSLRAGKPIHVLMPYAQALQNFSFWYRQLWAESLGKNGKGPTPVASLGPVDQHSQMQLYHDGPNDKTVTFIEVEKFASAISVPRVKHPEALAKLGKISFAHIMHAERAGTAEALTAAGKSNGTFYLPAINPETVGALLQCFMQATAYAGELLGVNAFDQPGVEGGKQSTNRHLGLL